MEKDLENVDSVASEDRRTASYADGTRLRANKASEPAGDSTQRTPDRTYVNGSVPEAGAARSNMLASTHIVTADSVQAEEVPTIPLDSLQTINALQPEVSVRSVASSRSAWYGRVATVLVGGHTPDLLPFDRDPCFAGQRAGLDAIYRAGDAPRSFSRAPLYWYHRFLASAADGSKPGQRLL